MEGVSAVFKVALALLSYHKDLILANESFESVTDILKRTIPDMSQEKLDPFFDEVCGNLTDCERVDVM